MERRPVNKFDCIVKDNLTEAILAGPMSLGEADTFCRAYNRDTQAKTARVEMWVSP
jgi:hypothetical protein